MRFLHIHSAIKPNYHQSLLEISKENANVQIHSKQMELTNFRVLIILTIVTISVVNGQTRPGYRVPQPTAAVLSPRGFRISIPGK